MKNIIKKILLSTGIIASLFISNHFLEIKAQVVNCPTNTTNVNGSCISNNNFLYSPSTNYIRPIVSSSTINPSNIKISTTTGNVLQNLNGLFSPATGGGSATNTLTGNTLTNTLTLSDTNGRTTSTSAQIESIFTFSPTKTISVPLAYSIGAGTFNVTNRTFDVVGGMNGAKYIVNDSIVATNGSNVFRIGGNSLWNPVTGGYIEINNASPLYKVTTVNGNNITVNRNYTGVTQTFNNYEVMYSIGSPVSKTGITNATAYQTALVEALITAWTNVDSKNILSYSNLSGFNVTVNGTYNSTTTNPYQPLGEIYVVDVTSGLPAGEANYTLYNQNQSNPPLWTPLSNTNSVFQDSFNYYLQQSFGESGLYNFCNTPIFKNKGARNFDQGYGIRLNGITNYTQTYSTTTKQLVGTIFCSSGTSFTATTTIDIPSVTSTTTNSITFSSSTALLTSIVNGVVATTTINISGGGGILYGLPLDVIGWTNDSGVAYVSNSSVSTFDATTTAPASPYISGSQWPFDAGTTFPAGFTDGSEVLGTDASGRTVSGVLTIGSPSYIQQTRPDRIAGGGFTPNASYSMKWRVGITASAALWSDNGTAGSGNFKINTLSPGNNITLTPDVNNPGRYVISSTGGGGGSISGEGKPNYLAIWNGTTSLSTSTIDYFSSTTEIAKLTLNGAKLGYYENFFNKGFYFTSNNYNENVGQLNTVFGNNALSSQTNAIATAAFGQSCLYSFDSGYGNTCYGIGGLNSLLIGGGNTALGENSLPALQGGNRNIGIGQNTNVLLLNADDQLNIGNWIYGNQGNISIGSSTAPYLTPAAQFYVDGITRLNNPLFLTQTNFKATSSILGNTGITPRQLTIDTAGNIYTANYASNSVSKITPAGATSILGTTGVNPFGIAVDSNGNVYTANSGVGNITKITPAGTSSIFATGLYYPWGMTIDSNNNLYVTSYFGNNVYKITSTGTITTLGTTGANPYNIIVGNDNFIYTTNYGSSSVSKINPTTGTSSILGNTGSLPYGLVMDLSGNIYTANDGSGTISKITPAGLSSVFAVTGGKPRGIVLDGKGKLYVTETQNDLIIMIDTTTGQTSTLISAIDNVIDPFGLVIDSSGVLYSANAGSNNVSKIFQPYLNKSLTIDNTGNVILGATSNGVNSVNNIQGDVNLNAGTGIGINNSGKNITITNTGSGTAGSGNAIDFTLNQWGEEALNVPSSERAYIKMGFTNSTEIGTGGSLAGVTYWDTSRNAPTGAGIGIRQQVATQFTNISLVVYTPAYTVNFTTPAGAVASNFALDKLLLSKRSASSTSEPFLNSNLFPTFRDSPGASDDVQMIPVVKPTITITGTAPNFTATISSGVWRSSFQNYNWNLSDTNVEYVPYLGIYETSGVTFPPTITSITRNSGLGGIQVLSSIPGTGGATPSLSQVVTVGNTLNSGQSISFPSVSSIQIADGTAGQFLVKGAGNSVTWGSGGSGSAPLKWGDISLNSFIASTTVSIATTTLSFSTPTTSIGTVDLRQLQVNGVLNSYYRFIPQIGNTFETSSFDSYWTTWNSVTKTLSGLVARRGIITN